MSETFYVSTDAYSAVMAVEAVIMEDAEEYGTKIVDEYTVTAPSGVCFIKIYERYYLRAERWISLYLVSDNFEDRTKGLLPLRAAGEGRLA